jgi:hypothetical protein
MTDRLDTRTCNQMADRLDTKLFRMYENKCQMINLYNSGFIFQYTFHLRGSILDQPYLSSNYVVYTLH